MQEQRFRHVKYCYRCYAMNSHIANKCSKPPDYKICSKCASSEHRWTNCISAPVKCINCSGSHETLSPSCPARKKLLEPNQHLPPSLTSSEKNFSNLNKSNPRPTASRSQEEPTMTGHNKYAQNDLKDKAIECFALPVASSRDHRRFDETLRKLCESDNILTTVTSMLGSIKIPTDILDSIDFPTLINFVVQLQPSPPERSSTETLDTPTAEFRSPSPQPIKKDRPPSPQPIKKDRSPSPQPIKKDRSPSPQPIKKDRSPSPQPIKKDRSPSPQPIKKDRSPSPQPIKKDRPPTPKNAAVKQERKPLAPATANPLPAAVGARHDVSKLKIDSLSLRNDDELLKVLKNGGAFTKEINRLITQGEHYWSQILKMKSLPEIYSLSTSEFFKILESS